MFLNHENCLKREVSAGGIITHCFLEAKKGVGRNSDRTRKRIISILDFRMTILELKKT